MTHDQEEALSIHGRRHGDHGGRDAGANRAPLEVYRNPVNRMAAEFIRETNIIEGWIRGPGSDGVGLEVDTPVGRVITRRHIKNWEPVANEPVFLSVRPEAPRVGGGADSPNRFTGHIVDMSYLGASAQYHLLVAEKFLLKISEANPVSLPGPSQTWVMATASIDDVVVLRS